MEASITIGLLSVVIGALIALSFFANYFRNRKSQVQSIAPPEALQKPVSKPTSKKPHSKPHSHPADKVTLFPFLGRIHSPTESISLRLKWLSRPQDDYFKKNSLFWKKIQSFFFFFFPQDCKNLDVIFKFSFCRPDNLFRTVWYSFIYRFVRAYRFSYIYVQIAIQEGWIGYLKYNAELKTNCKIETNQHCCTIELTQNSEHN